MRAIAELRVMARRLVKCKSGATSAEYAFLITLIAIVGALGFIVVGDGIAQNFTVLGERVESASTQMPNPLGGGGSGGGSGGANGGN